MLSVRPRAVPPPLRHPATAPLAVLAAGVAGAAYLYTTDPHEPGNLLPACPFRAVTGLLCPACGGTRMAYDLLHGDLAAAWHDNPVLLLAAPLPLWLLLRWGAEGLDGRRWRPSWRNRSWYLLVGAAAVWTVGRNLF